MLVYAAHAVHAIGLVFCCPLAASGNAARVHAAAFVTASAHGCGTARRARRPAARAAVPQPKRGPVDAQNSKRLVPASTFRARAHAHVRGREQSRRGSRLFAGHGRLTRGAATAHPLLEPADPRGGARPARAWHIGRRVACDVLVLRRDTAGPTGRPRDARRRRATLVARYASINRRAGHPDAVRRGES